MGKPARKRTPKQAKALPPPPHPLVVFLCHRRFIVPGDAFVEAFLRRAAASVIQDLRDAWSYVRALLPERKRSAASLVIEEKELTLTAALRQQMRSAPCYMGSTVLHLILFMILLLYPVGPTGPAPKILVETDIADAEGEAEEAGKFEEVDPEPDIDAGDADVDPVEVTVDLEIPDPMDMAGEAETADGGGPGQIVDFDMMVNADLPLLMGVSAFQGGAKLGNVGEFAGFATRSGHARGTLLSKGGGGADTENAVNWALAWLAAHQDTDGSWSVMDENARRQWQDAINKQAKRLERLGRLQKAKQIRAMLENRSQYGSVSTSAFALLAFLGAGHTPDSGHYRETVAKGLKYLIQQQDTWGCIGKHSYEAAIAMMAVAEAYGMTGDAEIRRIAEKCVNWANRSQCAAGGWNYQPSSRRNDTSVTGWWVMGLKSAQTAGIDVPTETWAKATAYLQKATDTGSGAVAYSCQADSVADVKAADAGPRLTAVSLCCLQFLGRPRHDPQVQGCMRKLLRDGLPESRDDTSVYADFYRWYYAALGLFQLGAASDAWQQWNPKMKETLLAMQVKAGGFEQQKGSWNEAQDVFGRNWGRAGQTALGALMLEVYYRYDNPHNAKPLPPVFPRTPPKKNRTPKPAKPKPATPPDDMPDWGWGGEDTF